MHVRRFYAVRVAAMSLAYLVADDTANACADRGPDRAGYDSSRYPARSCTNCGVLLGMCQRPCRGRCGQQHGQ